MGQSAQLTKEGWRRIEHSDCIIGAQRLLAMFADCSQPKFATYKPEEIQAILEAHPQYKEVAVVFSGDVGFYSGAKSLAAKLPFCDVKMIPGISSLVYLAAKLQIPWEEAAVVSIHGRQANAIHTIARSKQTFLLLGEKTQAEEFCEKLRHYRLEHLTVHIGRDLSYPQEEIVTKEAGALRPEDLTGLAAALVENPNPIDRAYLHPGDAAFIRGNVPMTKEEVRAVSLAKLNLAQESVFYDIGAGTGSMAVEAALFSGKLQVYAVEKHPRAVELVRENRQKFCTDNVKIIEGAAPEALTELPPPTHVFIGGSSGNLREILRTVLYKNADVKIVINAISLETVTEVMKAVEEGILKEPEITQMWVAKAKTLGAYHMMTGQNPIYVISTT